MQATLSPSPSPLCDLFKVDLATGALRAAVFCWSSVFEMWTQLKLDTFIARLEVE